MALIIKYDFVVWRNLFLNLKYQILSQSKTKYELYYLFDSWLIEIKLMENNDLKLTKKAASKDKEIELENSLVL